MKFTPIFAVIYAASSPLGIAADKTVKENSAIERITVSSDFRKQSVQQLSASVSVVGAKDIEARQAQHIEEILNLAANVNFASGASRGRFVQIRGIGERSQFAEPSNPSVGFLVDDIDFSGVVGIGTLFDVQQVEVLRGPQATEFGASAMAGVLKVLTTEAGPQQESLVSLSAGQKNTWSAGLAHGDAITDKLFYRVAAQQFKSDGYTHNTYLDKPTDNLDELTSRFKLKYLASDEVTLDLNYQYFDIDNGYDVFSLENDRNTRSDAPNFDTQRTHALGLSASVDYTWGQLKAVASLSDSDMSYGFDEDWTYVGFHPWEYESFDAYYRERESRALDLRVASNDSSLLFNNTTSWVLGTYISKQEEDLLRQYTYNDGDFTSQYNPQTSAIYGQLDTAINTHLSVQLGLRVDRYDIDYADNNGFRESINDTLVGGKVSLNYRVDNALGYISISRGYKAGGFNPDNRVPAEERRFDPEFNWNYELGMKQYLPDNAGYFRLAIFLMDREDTQVSDYAIFERDDNTIGFTDIIGNADTGTNKGVELETLFTLSEDVSLHANFGWLDATFSGYEQSNGDFVEQQVQAQAPKFTYNLQLQWHIAQRLVWRLDLDGKEKFRFSDGHDEVNPAYALLNTRLSYALDDWTLSVWGKNLTDKDYYVRGFGGFSNDPREFYEIPKPYYQLGDGRQLGVSVDYRF